tara:strand:- start:997 stop:1575 length:579 start_codon:yes stop_codon:yes gene_type:complete
MAFYFRPFPKVEYDLKKNNLPLLLTNVTARYKIRDVLKDKVAIYYDYIIKDSDRPDLIAYKYYDDETLDWLIYLVNDIIDPYYDWPLQQDAFEKYMRTLYGSVSAAKATVFEYRKILNKQTVLFDGTIIPERYVVVDQNVYNETATNLRREVDAYEYYEEENNEKRKIRLLDRRFAQDVKSEVELIFGENYN